MQTNLINGATSSYSIGSISDKDNSTLLKMWNTEVPTGKKLFQRHSHLNFEITVVNSGKGVYTTKDTEFKIEKGDVFVFSSNEYHCITDVGEEGLSFTNLHFEPRYLWGSKNDSFSSKNVNLCFSHSKNFNNRISNNKATELHSIINSIKSELIEQNEEYKLCIKSNLNLLLITLIRNFDYLDNSQSINHIHSKSIRAILNYIDEHFTEHITLEELSSIAGMSPNYFSSFFKKLSGINLWDYINSKRVESAARIIREKGNNINMLEVAILSGFNNTANFNKTFKKISGMTPSEYKKNTSYMIH